jgi:septal ring factor EnvC (AmiA/AmiB activator)
MRDNPLAVIISVIVVILIIVVLLQMLTEQQCKPYISQIQQKDAEITSLKKQLNQTETNLQQCRYEYNRLITENITKKDIEDIKQDFNLTRTQIKLLNQKFDVVNNNFVTVYHQLFFYFSISIILNIFLVIFIIGDVISATIFNLDIKKNAIEWILNKFKRKV